MTAPGGPAGVGPAGPADRRPPGRVRRPCSGDDDLLRLARGVARAWLELEAGRRGHRQLAALAPGAPGGAGPAPGPRSPVGSVTKVVGVRTAADRFDVVAIVRRGDRVGALAFRLRCRRGRWVVVASGRPEDQGQRPDGHGPDGPVTVARRTAR